MENIYFDGGGWGTGRWRKDVEKELPTKGNINIFPVTVTRQSVFLFPHKFLSYFRPRVLKLRINGFQQSGCRCSREMLLLNLLAICVRSCLIVLESGEEKAAKGLPGRCSFRFLPSGQMVERENDSGAHPLLPQNAHHLLLKHLSNFIMVICLDVSTRL